MVAPDPQEDTVNPSTDYEPVIDAIEAIDEPRSRRELLRSGGVAALAGVLGVFGITSAAAAKNGSTLKAGDKTTASKPTSIESSKGPALQARATSKKEPVGLRGVADAPKGIGVQGEATAAKGETVGVQGLAQSPDGVAGEFVADKSGTALRTKGRIELTGRSGRAPVSEGGAEFVIPVTGSLSDKSLVLATLQDHRPGVHVEAAYVLDAEEGVIVVRLNQAVAEETTVGWLVLN